LVLLDAMKLSYKFQARGHQAENWIMNVKKVPKLFQVLAIARNALRPPIRLAELTAEPLFAKERESGAEAMAAKVYFLILCLREGPLALRLNLKYAAQLSDETKVACLLGQPTRILVLIHVAEEPSQSPRLLAEGCCCG